MQENSSRSRIDRLRLSFSKLRADAFLVTHLPNIQYLCGFSGSAAVLLIEHSCSTLITDSRYEFQAREEVFGAKVRISKQGLLRAAVEVLKMRRGRCNVAYSPSHVTVAQKAALQALGGTQMRWVSGGDTVERLRAVKDAAELSIMREAATLISEVFEQVTPEIKPGISELGLAAEIEYAIKQLGGSGPSFETIVASGPRSAWAHARPTSKLLRKNELVVVDHGAILRGYCSDLTRTVFLGRAPAKVRRLYNAVLDAQSAATEAIRPGAKALEVDAAARRTLKGYRLAQYFTHSTGHGLGIEVHEMPRIGRGDETVLEEGMVVTIEPGVYIEGLGGIRIEDDVVVTAEGAEDLTSATREFLEL
ncbi:MAG TPA: Xaa-Pro peptidase family protein [Candidatus Acidoferrales bacterium]|nr:Xaa-Pro peptidase family protein [Candidatus Acidoferrales bacterium]